MKTLLSIIFFILAIAYLYYTTDLTVLVDNLLSYSIESILFLILFNILSLLLMGFRFTILFSKISFFNSLKINTISMGINQITPARAGDVAKPFMVKKLVNTKLSHLFAVITLERFLDVFILFILLLTFLPIAIEYIYALIIFVPMFIFLFRKKGIHSLINLIKKIKNKKIKNFLLTFYITLIKINKVKLIKVFFITVFMYFLYLITMFIFINSFSLFSIDFLDTITVFILTTLGLMVPSAPASLGTYEASMVFSLGLFDISKEKALSFALIYHFIQISTILILTGLFMIRKNNE